MWLFTGQWELNNQPVWILEHMQVAFDDSVTGKCAGQAQKWLRESNSMLHPGADMYPGDEDNGSMGAWFGALICHDHPWLT